MPNYAWYQINGDNHTWPVASLKPNDFGLFDMQGNAGEWCYDESIYYQAPSKEAAENAPSTAAVSESAIRMLRGGSYNSQALGVRSAWRSANLPAVRYYSKGFRPSRTYHLSP